MKEAVSKIVFIFSFVLLAVVGYAQTGSTQPDEAMDLFLLSILALFFGVLIIAALIGAFAGMVFIACLCGLVALGILSTSIIFALYRRSVSAGFKTFLVVIFGLACGIVGCLVPMFLNQFFAWHFSNQTLGIVGLLAGLTGEALTGILAYNFLQQLGRNVVNRIGNKKPDHCP